MSLNRSKFHNKHGTWWPRLMLIGALAVSAYLIIPPLLFGSASTKPANDASLTSSANRYEVGRVEAATRPIETLQVGERVLAHNPEVTPEERAEFVEPDWSEWLQLSLAMPKEDGSLLEIELLRPESWVRQQLALVVQERSPSLLEVIDPRPDVRTHFDVAMVVPSSYEDQIPFSPLRPIFRDLAQTGRLIIKYLWNNRVGNQNFNRRCHDIVLLRLPILDKPRSVFFI